jgi:NADH-quinone oxidoreductase subunit L
VVTLPLVLLAIPSILVGFLTVGPMLFGTDMLGHEKQLPFFLGAIEVLKENDVIAALAKEFHGPIAFAVHGFSAPAFWLALMGFLLATLLYMVKPEWRAGINRTLAWPIKVLENKYWMDDLWIGGFAGGGVGLGKLSRLFDSKVIDGVAVNGSAGVVGLAAGMVRKLQSGYLYHYAFAMILGLVALLALANHYWL